MITAPTSLGHRSRLVAAFALAASAMALGAAAEVRASVVGVTVANASTGNFTLTSLSVSRGAAAGTRTYLPSQLTGVDLTDVAAVQLPLAVQSGASVPAAGTRAALLEDGRLDTGVINPFSTGAAAADSFEVTFRTPVFNGPGADVVVLEIGSGDTTRFWVDGDRAGRGIDVAPANFSGALISGMTFTLYKYDNAGDQNVSDLAELESSGGFLFDKNDTGNIAGIALDLSSFGVPAGRRVSSLSFQSIGTASRLDAVYIAGLPKMLAGDTDGNGVVDLADLNNVLNNFGATSFNAPGDDNGDGVVDLSDLNNVLNNFGGTLAATAGPAALAVPEPSLSSSLLIAASAALVRRRRSAESHVPRTVSR